MLFLLAAALGIVLGAVVLKSLPEPRYNAVVRVAGAVAGFIVGFWGTYVIASHV